MARNNIANKIRTARDLPRLGWAFLTIGIVAAMLLALAPTLYAQSSPLTVQPSTGRVGVGAGNTNPGYTLDVSGTVNATSFRGDGSQLINLPQSSGSITALDKVTADTTVSNTAVETVLYTFSVPANTLGTNNRLRLVIQGEDRMGPSCSDCQDSYVFRLKYGGTTLFSSSAIYPWTPVSGIKVEFLLSADGATNSQVGLMTYVRNDSVVVTQGTVAIDSTVAQTLQVTVDWDVAYVNNIVKLKHAVLELVR